MTTSTNTLNAQSLMTAAQREAGLDDFGDQEFVEGLEVYTAALSNEAGLSDAGVMGVAANINRLLVNRLRFQDDLNSHPEILAEELASPIVVVGLARTGTSKLQGLLSAIPGVQRLDLWRLLNVAPVPGATNGGADPRIAVAQAYEHLMREHHPGLMAAHPFAAEEVNEESLAWELSFKCPGLVWTGWIPSYRDWFRGQSLKTSYQYLRSLLQYLQWQEGGAADRPFIMKHPAHLGSIDTLLETFPGAVVVHCHRSPTDCITSLCHAIEMLWRTTSDDVDPLAVGRYTLDGCSDWLARYFDQRDRLDGGRIIDVSYIDLMRSPVRVAEQILEHAHRPLSSESERAIEEWLSSNPQYKFGKYAYSMERYGLTPDMVSEALDGYFERFGSVLESPGERPAPRRDSE